MQKMNTVFTKRNRSKMSTQKDFVIKLCVHVTKEDEFTPWNSFLI